jgi:predicted secreted hydrolase
MQVHELVGPGEQGFARADKPIQLEFPRDHGPHPEFQSEWWYYTGNLEAKDGRHFGYQLTFFRRSLTPEKPKRDSKWATRELAMAHFAITGKDFHAYEQFGRPALGLAGFTQDRVWLGTWEVKGNRLHAAQDGHEIDLELETDRPPVLQGEGGFSRKGEAEGQASYYVSRTRLVTKGTVDGVPVQGLSWMDHEWTSNALGRNETGWDWFGLQLEDGRDVMYFQLRDASRKVTYRDGTLVHADGTWEPLRKPQLDVTRQGPVYPQAWKLQAENLPQLELEPYLEDQELNLSVRYWEGAVKIKSGGSGYAELTGYRRASEGSGSGVSGFVQPGPLQSGQ